MILLTGKRIPLNKKGFLLLETFVTITILIVGLIFVVRSFVRSFEAFKVSSEYFKAILITEQRLWDITQKKQFSTGTISGNVEHLSKRFDWRLEVSSLNENLPNLNQVRFELLWKNKRRENLEVVTYFKNRNL